MDVPSANSQALPAGTRMEQFLIERVLGSGGFGITYLALDARLNRKVVIKENLPAMFCFRDPGSLTVAPRHTTGEDADNFAWSLENFSKEAAMLASLDHSGIVRVLHSFEAFGTAYFVMPFVDGVAFDELIQERRGKNQPFSEEELRGLLDRVLDSLDHLHQRGIYHRDIKPGNILITNEGIPVLIDFGSARQRLSERSMTVVESAGYTPFEQLQSRGNIGPWSDLYALGGTLVKAITGETPPKATDRAFDDPFVPLAERPELKATYSSSFLRCLDRSLGMKPNDRWQNAGEWLAAPMKSDVQVARVARAVDPLPVATPLQGPTVSADFSPGEERYFELTPGAKIRMCWIPPGKFLMGSPEDEFGRHADEIQHQVEITRGFWLAKYPVTQIQWLTTMGMPPSRFGRQSIWENLFGNLTSQNVWKSLPVSNVSWNDVSGKTNGTVSFFDKLNGSAPSGGRFHLPTEAQWEYACRAGTTTSLNSDQNITKASGQCHRLGAVAWYNENSANKIQTVGLKQANAWGLHDMHGNVWEWCADWYGDYPILSMIDPHGAVSGSGRVFRGGSWSSNANGCRAAARGYNPENNVDNIGFRLVYSPDL